MRPYVIILSSPSFHKYFCLKKYRRFRDSKFYPATSHNDSIYLYPMNFPAQYALFEFRCYRFVTASMLVVMPVDREPTITISITAIPGEGGVRIDNHVTRPLLLIKLLNILIVGGSFFCMLTGHYPKPIFPFNRDIPLRKIP